MPPAAGCALGFDRLVMLATGATRIDQVIEMLHQRGDAPLVGVCRFELPQGLLCEILQFDPVIRHLPTDRRGG